MPEATRNSVTPSRARAARPLGAAGVVVAVAALWGLRAVFGYTLFHTVVEMYAIAVSIALFLTVWSVRRNVANGYLIWLAIGYACAATVDLAHTLLYKGMGVLPDIGSNPATQMWLVARYIQAGTLATAPFWIRRRIPLRVVMPAFIAVTAAGLAAVATGRFPAAFVEGSGLTAFKIGSEWVIVALLAAALVLLLRHSDAFEDHIHLMLAWSIILTMASELAFMLYTDPFGPANLVGHFLKAGSVFLVFRALVQSAVGEPLSVLFRETEQAQRELASAKDLAEALSRLELAISSSLDADEIMQRVIVEASGTIGADSATIVMRQGNAWIPRYTHRFPEDIIGRPFTDAEVPHAVLAAEQRTVVAIDDAFDDPRVNTEVMETFGIRSVLTVPLVSRDECIGTLYFNFHDAGRQFTAVHTDFANGLATALALALDNSRLYAEQREIADILQSVLLHMPASLPGVEMAHDYRSASELARIGGDFYDAFDLGDHTIGFVLGDVTGKGLEAATSTQAARSTFRAYAEIDPSPAEVLRRTNHALAHQLDEGLFVTAVYGVLDTATGRLDLGRAGHPEPVLCGVAGCTSGEMPGDPPLGLFPDLSFGQFTLDLSPGDLLLAFSDGLLDTRAADREQFGEARTRELMCRLKDGGPGAVVSGIMAAVAEFGGGRVTDDVTVFALRWPGPAA